MPNTANAAAVVARLDKIGSTTSASLIVSNALLSLTTTIVLPGSIDEDEILSNNKPLLSRNAWPFGKTIKILSLSASALSPPDKLIYSPIDKAVSYTHLTLPTKRIV